MKISPPLYEEQTEGKEQCVAVDCNCSHCERKAMISVHPLAKDVEFTQGLVDRVEYYSGMQKNPVRPQGWLRVRVYCSRIACESTP